MRCIIWHRSTLAAQVLPIGYPLSRLKCVLRGKHHSMMNLRLYKCQAFVYSRLVEDFPALYMSVYLKSKPFTTSRGMQGRCSPSNIQPEFTIVVTQAATDSCPKINQTACNHLICFDCIFHAVCTAMRLNIDNGGTAERQCIDMARLRIEN